MKVLASITFFNRHQQKIADLCSVRQQNGHHLIVICLSICLSMFITIISSGSTTQRCMHTNTQTHAQTQILSTFKMTQATTEMVQWKLESSTLTCHSTHVRKWKGTVCARLFLSSIILTSFKICLQVQPTKAVFVSTDLLPYFHLKNKICLSQQSVKNSNELGSFFMFSDLGDRARRLPAGTCRGNSETDELVNIKLQSFHPRGPSGDVWGHSVHSWHIRLQHKCSTHTVACRYTNNGGYYPMMYARTPSWIRRHTTPTLLFFTSTWRGVSYSKKKSEMASVICFFIFYHWLTQREEGLSCPTWIKTAGSACADVSAFTTNVWSSWSRELLKRTSYFSLSLSSPFLPLSLSSLSLWLPQGHSSLSFVHLWHFHIAASFGFFGLCCTQSKWNPCFVFYLLLRNF